MNHPTLVPDNADTGTSRAEQVSSGPPEPSRHVLLWWLHGATRLLLAVMLLFNGVIKLGLWQFGHPDVGEALIALGEMSPMGLLSRMVGFSPLFQLLAGLAEVGASVALIWRRTVVFGALVSTASMTFVLVLNLGYDMPAKQLAIALLVMSLVILAPWAKRIVVAIIGDGPVPAAVRPRLFRSERPQRLARVIAPVTGLVVLMATGLSVAAAQPTSSIDESLPSGVWRAPADDSAQGSSWEDVALGNIRTDGAATAQVRLRDGSLLTGTYVREGSALTLTLRPLQQPGQSALQYARTPAETVDLAYAADGDDRLTLSGDQDLALERDANGSLLFDRGFTWKIRADDPFER